MIVVLGDVAIDCGLEVDDRAEDAAFEPSSSECREESLHRIEPGGRGRCEVEMEPWMAA